jgi:hypothetical protein
MLMTKSLAICCSRAAAARGRRPTLLISPIDAGLHNLSRNQQVWALGIPTLLKRCEVGKVGWPSAFRIRTPHGRTALTTLPIRLAAADGPRRLGPRVAPRRMRGVAYQRHVRQHPYVGRWQDLSTRVNFGRDPGTATTAVEPPKADVPGVGAARGVRATSGSEGMASPDLYECRK